MKKITQEAFDAFKIRVINKCMKDIKEYGAGNNDFEFHPTLYLKAFNKTNKEIALPGELFSNEKGKEICANVIKEMIVLSESPMMCFITEGYQARLNKKEVDMNNLPRPSELPEDQRDIVLFMCFESYNLPQYFISFIKTYNKDTNTWTLKPHPKVNEINNSNDPKSSVEGKFANFYSN